MALVKLNAALPTEQSQDNGLDVHADRIMKKLKDNILAVVVLNATKVELDVESGTRQPQLKIVGIEVVDPGSADEAVLMDILELYRSNRTGQAGTRHYKDMAENRRAALAARRDTSDLF